MSKSALKTKLVSARELAKKRLLSAKKAARTRFLNRKELEEQKRCNLLVEQNMGYAASIASRVAKSLSAGVDYDDVLCNARLGLLDAAKRFDEKQKVDFKTFAYYRIKGAIYDGLRKSGWIPRSMYSRIKFEEASNDYLQFMSETVKEDHAANTDISDTVNTLASIYVVSLDADEEFDVEDTSQENLEKRAEFMQVRNHMRDAISVLPPKEKQLIMMYYFQNKTFEEIGEKLGLSKSWVSRMHATALEMLFKRIRVLAAQGDLEEGDFKEAVKE